MKIIVAIGGASGAIYAKRLLMYLNQSSEIEQIAITLTPNAEKIYKEELGEKIELTPKTKFFDIKDFNAPFASGSSNYDAMVICPCSVGILARISVGTSDNLLLRAADVMMKERRKLILVLRETPYNLIHIQNMCTLTQSGAIILPASPSFYSHPQNIDQLVDTVIFRILDLLNISNNGFRWGKN